MSIIELSDNLVAEESLSLREGLKLIDKNGQQILLINDSNNVLCGIVTDADVRRYLLTSQSIDVSLAMIMNKNFIYLTLGNESDAKRIFSSNNIIHLPVVDNDGKLVKLLFKGDNNNSTVSDIPVVIMAGGKGERLLPLTKIIPKPLIPIGEVTMIEKVISHLGNQGFKRFFIVVNYKKELIKSYLNEVKLPFDIKIIEEKQYLGTVGGLREVGNYFNDERFLLTNCDILADLNYNLLLQWHSKKGADLTILAMRKKTNIPYGVVSVEDNYVIDINEKPFLNHLIITGIYIIDSNIIDLIPSEGSLEMDILLDMMLKKKKKISCFPIDNGWYDMGQFNEFKKLVDHIDF